MGGLGYFGPNGYGRVDSSYFGEVLNHDCKQTA